MSGPPPLSGMTVLDLSRVLSGPLCAATLGDLGASVIKIERPQTGDDSRHFGPFVNGESSYFMALNRGKQSITLDLKSSDGRALLLRLLETADVLVENFRPGVTERLGISYQSVREINPGLVYASISGFGQTGPHASRPAYDHIVQAMGGIMSVTGWPDGPPTRVGDAMGDVVAGLYASWGVLASLLQRAQTGQGQHVDVAMLDAVFSLQVVTLAQLLGGSPVPGRVGNGHPISAPMDAYAAADGPVVIAVANDALYRRLVSALGDPEMDDPRFATDGSRQQNQDELRKHIESWTSQRTVNQVVAELEQAGVPAAPIWDLAQLAESEHARHRGLLRSVQHPTAGSFKVPTQPVKLSNAEVSADLVAPLLGQHTESVLKQRLGLNDEELADLRQRGVI